MTHRPGDPRFYRLLDEIANLHARKSADYSPAADPLKNFRAAADVGVRPYAGVLTRLGDKWGRIATFAKSGQLQNESARDSHIDSAVYHLIAVLLLEDEAEAKWALDEPRGGCMGDPDPTPPHTCEPGQDFGDGSGICVTCGCTLFPLCVTGSDDPLQLPEFGPGSPAATGDRVYQGEQGDPDRQWAPV